MTKQQLSFQTKNLNNEVLINKDRLKQAPFLVRDLLWYLRPPDSPDTLASKWKGPAKVIAR